MRDVVSDVPLGGGAFRSAADRRRDAARGAARARRGRRRRTAAGRAASRCRSCTAARTAPICDGRRGVRRAVAARTVIDRHTRGRTIASSCWDFCPGFAYMGRVDAGDRRAAAARRRALRVPAGSRRHRRAADRHLSRGVSRRMADRSAGRRCRVFDARRAPPSLFAPGDRVRFVPRRRRGAGPLEPPIATRESGHDRAAGPARITVLRPGLFTTIQDSGRWGHQDRGVPVAGADGSCRACDWPTRSSAMPPMRPRSR